MGKKQEYFYTLVHLKNGEIEVSKKAFDLSIYEAVVENFTEDDYNSMRDSILKERDDAESVSYIWSEREYLLYRAIHKKVRELTDE